MFKHNESNKYELVKISKDYVLDKLTEETIWEYYTKRQCKTGYDFTSPFREDKRPTANYFKHYSGSIWMKDWNGDFVGDCFNAVQRLHYLDNRDLIGACKIILRDILGENFAKVEGGYAKTQEEYTPGKKLIQVERRGYNEYDKKYWTGYYLNRATLNKFYVFCIKLVWLEGRLIYTYDKNDPCYGYYFGEGEWKLYFPKRKNKYRFLTNSRKIQGLLQLPEKGEDLLITKSYKDVMCLDLFNVPALAPQSETSAITPEIMADLKTRFKRIGILYDFDYAGIKFTNKLSKQYNLPYLFITNGRFGTPDMGSKDFSDYLYANGMVETELLIDNVYGNF